MSKPDQFKGSYEVEDGYVGKSRPKYFSVSALDLADDMTDDELRDLYSEAADEHFRQCVTFALSKEDEFVEWAREQINRSQP